MGIEGMDKNVGGDFTTLFVFLGLSAALFMFSLLQLCGRGLAPGNQKLYMIAAVSFGGLLGFGGCVCIPEIVGVVVKDYTLTTGAPWMFVGVGIIAAVFLLSVSGNCCGHNAMAPVAIIAGVLTLGAAGCGFGIDEVRTFFDPSATTFEWTPEMISVFVIGGVLLLGGLMWFVNNCTQKNNVMQDGNCVRVCCPTRTMK